MGVKVERYKDRDGDSNVAGYEIGQGYIDVEFKTGAVYRYTNSSAGAANIERMILRAKSGDGLNAFINTHVRKRYSAKMK